MYSRLYRKVSFIFSCIAGITAASSQDVRSAFCSSSGISFLFFNGVRTEPYEAYAQLKEISLSYGSTSSSGKAIRYDVAYNTSTYKSGSMVAAGWRDILEMFDQRFSQQPVSISSRYELFFEALKGGGSLSDPIAGVSPGYLQFLLSLSDPISARYVTSILNAKSATLTDYANHIAKINREIDDGNSVLLYAHSQGNLFASQAYRYAFSKVGTDRVKIVHIAPANAPDDLYGDYILADRDLVINGALKAIGPVAMPNVSIPPYDDRPAGLALGKSNGKDRLGHKLLEIYLNRNLRTYENTVIAVNKAEDGLRLACPNGSVNYGTPGTSTNILIDGLQYNSTGGLPNGSFFITNLKPGKHTISFRAVASTSSPPSGYIRLEGNYRFVDGSISKNFNLSIGVLTSFEISVTT